MEDGNTSGEVNGAQPEVNGVASEPGPIDPVAAFRSEVERLTAENQKLASDKAELQDLALRRQADYDNFRKRSERERAEYVEYAAMETCKSLLPVIDDFERALKAASAGEDDALKEYVAGVQMIYQNLVDTLTKLGLQPIDCANKPFDPNLHYAVQKVEREDVEDQTVLEDFQRGYHFKSRLLRPAMVKVAVKP